MSTPEFIRTASKQYALITRLIEEAEAAKDPKKSALLMGMARDETDNVARTLRHYLARKRPAHRLSKKAVA